MSLEKIISTIKHAQKTTVNTAKYIWKTADNPLTGKIIGYALMAAAATQLYIGLMNIDPQVRDRGDRKSAYVAVYNLEDRDKNGSYESTRLRKFRGGVLTEEDNITIPEQIAPKANREHRGLTQGINTLTILNDSQGQPQIIIDPFRNEAPYNKYVAWEKASHRPLFTKDYIGDNPAATFHKF